MTLDLYVTKGLENNLSTVEKKKKKERKPNTAQQNDTKGLFAPFVKGWFCRIITQ